MREVEVRLHSMQSIQAQRAQLAQRGQQISTSLAHLNAGGALLTRAVNGGAHPAASPCSDTSARTQQSAAKPRCASDPLLPASSGVGLSHTCLNGIKGTAL